MAVFGLVTKRFRTALVHGCGGANSTDLAWSVVSGCANGKGLCNPDHVVERLNGDSSLASLGRQDAGVQLRSDDRLVAPDRGLYETAPAVACCFLPRHAALLGNDPDVVIALALRLSALRTRHRRGTRRNDNIRYRIGLVSDDHLVHRLPVIRTVRRH